MTINYIQLTGEVIDIRDLKIPKAIEVASAVNKLPYYKFIECRKVANQNEIEIIIFEVQVEVGQETLSDILPIERIAVVFHAADDSFPEVLALRDNFPKVPHLNLTSYELPRSLCLFNERYDELKLHWTPYMFIERIREWLALTAKGMLHAENQPLEPLFITPKNNLVIPFDLFSSEANLVEPLIVHGISSAENRITLIAEHKESNQNYNKQKNLIFVAIPIMGEAQQHGIIYKQPSNIFELHEFLLKAKVNLLSKLRDSLMQIYNNKRDYLIYHLILILYLPKIRNSDQTEATDYWAFFTEKNLQDIGAEIGLWGFIKGGIGLLLPRDLNKNGQNIVVELVNPNTSYSRKLATRLSGFSDIETVNILQIGVGALGSQVFLDLIRMAYGNWTIVDEDCFLPHNLARHALTGHHIGFSKAEILALEANTLVKGDPIAQGFTVNILKPDKLKEEIEKIYNKVDVIIDASTSIPVARHIALDINSTARRISIFLNPTGEDSVILAEASDRGATLDCLEMQYYRYLINEPALHNHLSINQHQTRYARSCRDISNSIPQDLVAVHSAICSRGIRNILAEKKASIQIRTFNTRNCGVQNYDAPIYNVSVIKKNSWTIKTDQYLLGKISQIRKEKLPNETGGVLIGAFDMQRKLVYVVDTIASPPDSVEWPAIYIRGCKGLGQAVLDIQKRTGAMLEYVGEWHSHPNNCSTLPSSDDIRVFKWLSELMGNSGLPGLMIISGDKCQISFNIETME